MHRRTVTGILILLLVNPTCTGEVMSAESSQLKSSYPDYAGVADEGHRKYMAAGCNGCHGVGVAVAWRIFDQPVWMTTTHLEQAN